MWLLELRVFRAGHLTGEPCIQLTNRLHKFRFCQEIITSVAVSFDHQIVAPVHLHLAPCLLANSCVCACQQLPHVSACRPVSCCARSLTRFLLIFTHVLLVSPRKGGLCCGNDDAPTDKCVCLPTLATVAHVSHLCVLSRLQSARCARNQVPRQRVPAAHLACGAPPARTTKPQAAALPPSGSRKVRDDSLPRPQLHLFTVTYPSQAVSWRRGMQPPLNRSAPSGLPRPVRLLPRMPKPLRPLSTAVPARPALVPVLPRGVVRPVARHPGGGRRLPWFATTNQWPRHRHAVAPLGQCLGQRPQPR